MFLVIYQVFLCAEKKGVSSVLLVILLFKVIERGGLWMELALYSIASLFY